MITPSISALARWLVLVNAIAFGLALFLAISATWSTAMWIALAAFGATMLAQGSLYLHVVAARRIARRESQRTVQGGAHILHRHPGKAGIQDHAGHRF